MRQPRNSRGFTLVEIAIAIVIGLVIMAVSIPTTLRAIKTYRLGSAAINVANLLTRARSEAIKANSSIASCGQPVGTQWRVWINVNKNPNCGFDPSEPFVFLPADMTFLGQNQVPPPDSMQYGGNPRVAAGAVCFDSRGTVDFACTLPVGAPAVILVYLGYANDPSYGYRAIAITPSGKTKIWRASQGGTWFGG